MNNLLQFLVKHIPWFVFIIYVIISCVLLFSNNPFQQSVYLSSANGISATVYEGYSGVSSYFGLKSVNEDLQARNTALELEEKSDPQLSVADSRHVGHSCKKWTQLFLCGGECD